MKRRRLKIGIACSPGGHMVQARQLEQVYMRYDYFYFTFAGKMADEIAKRERVLVIPNITRYNPLTLISGVLFSLYYALKERPDLVISTGAGVTVFFCFFSKLMGAKLVFLESVAKVTRPTLTARMIYPISDLFIVQWPDLRRYFPKAIYAGRLF